MSPTIRFVTDLGRSFDYYAIDAEGKPTGEQVGHVARYGVWEQGGAQRKAEAIDTDDDLALLCARHGLDPATVVPLLPHPEPARVVRKVQ